MLELSIIFMECSAPCSHRISKARCLPPRTLDGEGAVHGQDLVVSWAVSADAHRDRSVAKTSPVRHHRLRQLLVCGIRSSSCRSKVYVLFRDRQ